jgi:hypothetical protein
VNPRKVNPVNPKKFSEDCHLISSEVAQRRGYAQNQYRTLKKIQETALDEGGEQWKQHQIVDEGGL